MSDSIGKDYQIIQNIENFDETLKQTILESLENAKNISGQAIYDKSSDFKGELQQGDILLNMPVVDFENATDTETRVKNGPCIVLSNTCDLNVRKRAVRITYAPIIRASAYLEVLKKTHEDQKGFDGWVKSTLKKQQVNKLIWLEPSDKLPYEGIVVLDHLLSARLDSIFPTKNDISACWAGSMTMTGWYFMVGKLTSFYYRPTDEQLLFRLGLAGAN